MKTGVWQYEYGLMWRMGWLSWILVARANTFIFFFLMVGGATEFTLSSSAAASDVYEGQGLDLAWL